MGTEKTLKKGRSIHGRFLAAMLLAACVSGSQSQTVLASDGNTETGRYGCSPVTEDLSMLPAMENRV